MVSDSELDETGEEYEVRESVEGYVDDDWSVVVIDGLDIVLGATEISTLH